MAQEIHLNYTADLGRGVTMQPLRAALFSRDEYAHRFAVRCTRDGKAVSLTGAEVKGYFLRADGTTVIITGAVEEDAAVVTLPPACYNVQGRFSLVVKATMGDVVSTILWAEGAVQRSQTDAVLTEETIVPSLEELLARIEAMESAADEARAAAKTALDAAASIESQVVTPITDAPSGRGVIHLEDASGSLLQNLQVFGRTTQASAPTPDAPVSPMGPGNSGSVGVTVVGKNLFDKDNVAFAVGLINASGTVDTSITYYMHTETYIPVRPNTAYVFSGDIVTSDRSNSVAFYDRDKAFIERYASGVAGQNSQFTTPAGCYYIRFNAATSYDADTIQLEVGDIATAYEAYTAQTASMATWSLQGVQVASGGNYIDEEGQMWLADYINGATGQRITNIPVEHYTGSNYTPVAANSDGTAFQMALPSAGYPIDYSVDQTGMVYSNRLPTLSRERVINGEQGVAINNTHVIVCVEGITTVDALVAWLAASQLTVVYRPAAALGTVIDMTEAEALAWKALTTHKPNTTIYNDADAWMEATYIADLKAYIDNRIAALVAAL